jgi:hypothetical protein
MIMCVTAIDYLFTFIDEMHYICTVSLGTLKGAFKIKCIIIMIILLRVVACASVIESYMRDDQVQPQPNGFTSI